MNSLSPFVSSSLCCGARDRPTVDARTARAASEFKARRVGIASPVDLEWWIYQVEARDDECSIRVAYIQPVLSESASVQGYE
jgi:hypothetical protein